MKSRLKIIGLTAVIVIIFVYICTYLGEISGTFISEGPKGINPEAGGNIFWKKGRCGNCHRVGNRGSARRCPNQFNLAIRADERAKERGLSSGTEYLVESLVDPKAYIVEGFAPIMPKVYEPPILLHRNEILAVLTYLQSFGKEPDVSEVMRFTDKIPRVPVKKFKPWISPIPASVSEGERLFFDATSQTGCVACHMVDRRGGELGPDLSNIGSIQTPQYIMDSIMRPSEVIVPGFETVFLETVDGIPFQGVLKSKEGDSVILVRRRGAKIEVITIPKDEVEELFMQELSIMPENFGELLTLRQFYSLVKYLISLK
ncbi:MAG: c-type cytochrome [Candidatus Scalinduaceae bacterium]